MDTICYICYFKPDTDMSALEALLPAERLEKLRGFSDKRRRQSLLAEALLRQKLYEHTGSRDFLFSRRVDGRPECSICQISLSHTEGAVAAAFSPDAIGIDTELFREARPRAAKAYFAPAEFEHFSHYGDRVFWEIWTRKEAYAKAMDTGLVRELNQVDTLSSTAAEKLFTGTALDFVYSIYSENECSVLEITAEELISSL